MECMIENCEAKFVDDENGLTTMLWHMAVQHPKEEINNEQ